MTQKRLINATIARNATVSDLVSPQPEVGPAVVAVVVTLGPDEVAGGVVVCGRSTKVIAPDDILKAT